MKLKNACNLALLAATALAAGIPSSSIAQSGSISGSVQDINVIDGDNNETGDGLSPVNNLLLGVGENSGGSQEQRAWIPFTLTAPQRLEIAAAFAITLDLRVNFALNIDSLRVDIYGIADRTSDVAVPSDYQATSTLLVNDAFTVSTPTSKQSFDVTAFAKAEAARGTNSVICFLLRADPNVPNLGTIQNTYYFDSADAAIPQYRPSLTIVPEPSSVALILTGAAILVRRMQRKAK